MLGFHVTRGLLACAQRGLRVDVWVKGLLLAGVYGWGQEKSPLARALGGSEAVTQVEGHNRHEPVSSGRSRLARRMT